MSYPYIDIHTHKCTSRGIAIRSFEMDQNPCIGSSVGVHPYRLTGDLVLSKGVIAIGEIGLDYSVLPLDKAEQQRFFHSQLQLAEERGLPVIIHCVRAYNDVISILKNYKLKAVIFHGFLANGFIAKTLSLGGYYISLGHRSLSSTKTLLAVKSYPMDRIFLETDDSEFTIEQIYDLACHHMGWDLDDLKQQIYNNYKYIFNE